MRLVETGVQGIVSAELRSLLDFGDARLRHFQFPGKVLAAIAPDRFFPPNPRVQWRLDILWLKQHGETPQRIAELADTSWRTVQRVLDILAASGLAAVRQFHEKGRTNA